VLETKDLAFAMIADKVVPIRSSVVADWSGGEVGGRRPRKQWRNSPRGSARDRENVETPHTRIITCPSLQFTNTFLADNAEALLWIPPSYHSLVRAALVTLSTALEWIHPVAESTGKQTTLEEIKLFQRSSTMNNAHCCRCSPEASL